MRNFSIILLIILFPLSAKSQEVFEWNAQYFSFLDNREYNRYIAKPQTIFGNRIDLSVGFRIDSVHLVQFGTDYLYEFGSKVNSIPLFPTIYYSYSDTHSDFNFGAFPRNNKLNYPKLLLNDTLNYYRPNIEGFLFNYKGTLGNQNVWIDWVGRQTNTENERFLAGTSGNIKKGYLFFENYLYMYHHAATAIRDTAFHLRDNGGGVLTAGFDFTKQYYFKISIGAAFSYDRYRPNPYQISKGFYGKLIFEYERMMLTATHYNGESISLGYGDAIYKTGQYTRIDVEYNFIKYKKTNLNLQFSGHLYPDNFDFSQKLTLIVNLNGKMKK